MEFMTRRTAYLMEEQENKYKLLNTRDLDVEAIRALEEPKNTKIPNSYDEGVLPLDLKKESHHHEVTMSREDKNQMTKTKINGKKGRKISKKRDKIEKLKKILEETLHKEKSQELSFAGILK
jgi:hypothetical protein